MEGEDDIMEDVSCPVCFEILDDPRSLSCGHTFCRPCLDRIQKSSKIDCPKCKRNTPLSIGGVMALPKNYGLADIADKMRKKNLCKGHNKILSLFCQDCELMLCVGCLDTHIRHKIGPLDGAYQEEKKNMEQLLETAKSASIEMHQALKYTRMITKFELARKQSEKSIETFFDQLIEELNSKRKDMLDVVRQDYGQKIDIYTNERSIARNFRKTLRNVESEYTSLLSSDKSHFLKEIKILNQRLAQSLLEVCNLPQGRSFDVPVPTYRPIKKLKESLLDKIAFQWDNEKLWKDA